jgi:membrane-associated phospholipid phosphatase
LNLDWLCVSWVHAHQNPFLHSVAKTLSAMTSSKACCLAAAIVAVLWMFRGWYTRGAIIFFGTGLSALLAELLKLVFQRDRPPFSTPYNSYSFPSGHVLTSTVFFGLLAWTLGQDFPSRRKLFLRIATAFVVLVGCSRVYLELHWPSDVIGLLFMKGWQCLTSRCAKYD